ncbi:hypothetical protein H0H93_006039 [Arthromyces matolae]|nr:hypothetical protein H0H93_006039 [Arthromyces matolae]
MQRLRPHGHGSISMTKSINSNWGPNPRQFLTFAITLNAVAGKTTRNPRERSRIADAIVNYNRKAPCKIYQVDVNNRGLFTRPGKIEFNVNGEDAAWTTILRTERPPDLRVRALFLENLSGPILQMLGAKYNIEPCFWSSSLNWIPSRYQENPIPGQGDREFFCYPIFADMTKAKQMIDTQAPLKLRSKRRILVLDLLSVHLIRNSENSTIISYHPEMEHHPTTKASYLWERIRYAGQSVYWQIIFQKYPDPTFVLLTFVWHALYAWDEALEHLYNHICWLETKVIKTNDLVLTREFHAIRSHDLHYELHVVRAYHLYYSSLLENFQKAVKFIQKTKNPALQALPEAEQRSNADVLKRECKNLISEIERLEMSLNMQDKRLMNVMNLVFSNVNIEDSQQMKRITEAAAKDSAGVSDPTLMRFMLTSAIFGMNVDLLVPQTNGTLSHYFAVAMPLTIVTIWVIVAFQSNHLYPEKTGFLIRFGWPVRLCLTILTWNKEIPFTTQEL